VPVRFVHHVEARGSESLGQLLRDEIAPGHGVRIAGARPASQCRSHGLSAMSGVLTPPHVARQSLVAPALTSNARNIVAFRPANGNESYHLEEQS
jgi:hypothetical protein